MTPTAAATRVFRPMLSLGRGCAASVELSGVEMVTAGSASTWQNADAMRIPDSGDGAQGEPE